MTPPYGKVARLSDNDGKQSSPKPDRAGKGLAAEYPHERDRGVDRARMRRYIPRVRRRVCNPAAGRRTEPHALALPRCLVGDSLTVELRTLTPLVQVRILVPQPSRKSTRSEPTDARNIGRISLPACTSPRDKGAHRARFPGTPSVLSGGRCPASPCARKRCRQHPYQRIAHPQPILADPNVTLSVNGLITLINAHSAFLWCRMRPCIRSSPPRSMR